MPAKAGGRGAGWHKRNHSLNNQPRQSTSTQSSVHAGKTSLVDKSSQSNFSIAPLVLEGVKLNKMELNDLLKQHLNDVRISDIQLGRTGIFTLYAMDVKSFNRLLNEFTLILTSNGQQSAKIYVPRSIQRIKDTERIAFVKRVDLEIPDDRITEALKNVGLDVTNVTRLSSKDGKTPTRTIKITFGDVPNRNTFVHTGLQVDCMHFTAEPASQNTKPMQCFICMKYNHIAKYCKTLQQVCARCGENHRMDQCTVANDAVKCCNCKGNHLATSNDCSHYREQEKRMLNQVNQYSTTRKPVSSAPAIYNTKEFPPLPNLFEQQKEILQSSLFDDILNALSKKMETIIEEATDRIFKALQQKIKKMEKSICIPNKKKKDDDDVLTSSDSDSNEESQVVQHIKLKQQQHAEAAKQTTSTTVTSNKPTTDTSTKQTTSKTDTSSKPTTSTTDTSTKQTATTNTITPKTTKKQKEETKSAKRGRSPNTSLNTSTNDKKDLKTSKDDD